MPAPRRFEVVGRRDERRATRSPRDARDARRSRRVRLSSSPHVARVSAKKEIDSKLRRVFSAERERERGGGSRQLLRLRAEICIKIMNSRRRPRDEKYETVKKGSLQRVAMDKHRCITHHVARSRNIVMTIRMIL